MPSMSLMLEGLVTTLLSLDYLHQKEAPPLTYKPKNLATVVPSRCRSNSLSSASTSSDSSESDTEPSLSGNNIYQYHCPPCGGMTFYDDNPTVFGSILRGELPAVTLAESSRLLALQDIKPRAPLHALVIPKAFVGSIFDIDDHDLEFLQEVHDMALELVKTHHPQAYETQDYRLCFHIPPFNSVDHLHLHVLAPVSKMGWYYRYIKYNPRTRWCTNMEPVLERLQRGDTAVPYRRPLNCQPQKPSVGLLTNGEVCDSQESSETDTPTSSGEMTSTTT